MRHLGIAAPIEHPSLGSITLVAQPTNISGISKELRTPAPELGQHTSEVLGELGYDETTIAALRAKRIV